MGMLIRRHKTKRDGGKTTSKDTKPKQSEKTSKGKSTK